MVSSSGFLRDELAALVFVWVNGGVFEVFRLLLDTEFHVLILEKPAEASESGFFRIPLKSTFRSPVVEIGSSVETLKYFGVDCGV